MEERMRQLELEMTTLRGKLTTQATLICELKTEMEALKRKEQLPSK